MPASTAKITQTWCRRMRLPTTRGVRKLPSMNWPSANTAATIATGTMAPNWNAATVRPTATPTSMPT